VSARFVTRNLIVAAVSLMATACTTLPDVKPFADATASLSTAAGSQYREIESELDSLEVERAPGDSDQVHKALVAAKDNAGKAFKANRQAFDAMLAAMVTYSEKLASLAAAGKEGAEAANSLLDTFQGFASLAGVSGIPAGPLAKPITDGFKLIADEVTKRQAAASLSQAVEAAQPGVDKVAEVFEKLYGTAVPAATRAIRNTRKRNASARVGGSIIGFHKNVTTFYNEYYLILNGLIAPPGGTIGGSAWKGFCEDGKATCRARDELQAVSLIDERMEAIRPMVESYDTEVAAADAARQQRLQASLALIRAVRAWSQEHRNVARSLNDKTDMSAFNLKAALLEVAAIFTKKP